MSNAVDTPWFVRVRTATRFQLNPVSWQGWGVTLCYVLIVWAIWFGIGQLRPRGLHVFATVGALVATLVATALLVLIALRTSVPTTGSGRPKAPPLGEEESWFMPHAFGIGATPVTWQGWALTIGFSALLVADIRLMHERIAQIAIGVALFAVFTVIAVRKTKGGWHWRWGVRG
jgi:hypothetical protein